MASQTFVFRNPNLLSSPNLGGLLPLNNRRRLLGDNLSNPTQIAFYAPTKSNPPPSLSLSLRSPKMKKSPIIFDPYLTFEFHTLTQSESRWPTGRLYAHKMFDFFPELNGCHDRSAFFAAINYQPFSTAIVPITAAAKGVVVLLGAFFAANYQQSPGTWITPIAAVARWMVELIELYYEILSVRLLLSWFPNVGWEKQPFSALRDLCDPFLVLFRKIVPPINGAFDVSPILACFMLGTIISIFSGTKLPG